jgi:hypothetical protein
VLGGAFFGAMVWGLAAQTLNALPATSLVAEGQGWPPENTAWVGDRPHQFLGGELVLFCGSHGVFSTQTMPPSRQGQSSTIQYGSVFEGELTLNPPHVRRSRTYAIEDPIRITERVTVDSVSRSGTVYATELIGLTFEGSDFPDQLRIRESPRRRSAGRTSIHREGSGTYRIDSSYQVWLEVSLDDGRTWHVADNAVSMTLRPESKAATIKARRSGD